MIDVEQVIKEISKETKIDKEIVNVVCKHVFRYTVEIMKDVDDTQDILFNDLFRFKLKSRFKNDKTKNYSPKIYNYEDNKDNN